MILVTGASGTVGSALLEELRTAGVPVRAAYHSPDKADRDVRAGHQAVTIDLAEPATLPPALDGVEAVFLLGAMSPAQTDHELNLVRAAESAGVARLVKLSVLRADELLTPIAGLHRPVEEALESSHLTWTFLRPNFYMQNFIRQAARIRDTGAFAQSDDEARAGMLRGGLPEFYADALIEVGRAYRHGGAEMVTSTVRDLTGRDPITFERFVRDHQAAFS